MTADTVGGVWTYALELARALDVHGVEIALATMGAPLTADQRAEADGVSNVELFESSFRLEWMDDPWGDVSAAGDWLLELESAIRPDLVHLNSYAHGALPWCVPRIIVGHSCVLSWWRAVKGCDAPIEWDVYRDAVRSGLYAADVIVAPSRMMLNALDEHYGPSKSSAVIPNGRRLPASPVHAKEPFILAAGRLWDEAKNISTLARVAPELSWPVCVAGEEQNPDGRCATHEHVRALGRLSTNELAGWFERASIYALPARYEPFGLSVLEAALAGCALVLGDLPSLRDIWSDAAVFVPADNPVALASALRVLIDDPSRRVELGARAREAAARFTPERMAVAYLFAYAQAMGRTQPHIESKEMAVCES